ncbi:inner membrane protein [Photobacterium aquae]|uniref:Inner membrane protein n=1 Tax=Photobacterium aquae TaxID=1195763 RepID=A0A0J1K3R4_9GAMM|nr:DUF805 domain-containing protein [Photobacterium aquae]KLV09052.1 inner membrane protein [Photobacterium aquae]
MNQMWALFSFQGRMRRRDYWLYSLPVLLVMMPVIIYSPMDMAAENDLQSILSLLITGFAMWASMALNAKRLHDRGKSAWWLILTFAPLVGPVFVIIELGCLDGTKGDNAYGPDPKGRGEPPLPPQDGQESNKDTMTIDI